MGLSAFFLDLVNDRWQLVKFARRTRLRFRAASKSGGAGSAPGVILLKK